LTNATVSEKLFQLEAFADRVDPAKILWESFFGEDGRFIIDPKAIPEVLSEVGEGMVLNHQFSQPLDSKSPLLKGRHALLGAVRSIRELQEIREGTELSRRELLREVITVYLRTARRYFQEGGREYPYGFLCVLFLELPFLLKPEKSAAKKAPE